MDVRVYPAPLPMPLVRCRSSSFPFRFAFNKHPFPSFSFRSDRTDLHGKLPDNQHPFLASCLPNESLRASFPPGLPHFFCDRRNVPNGNGSVLLACWVGGAVFVLLFIVLVKPILASRRIPLLHYATHSKQVLAEERSQKTNTIFLGHSSTLLGPNAHDRLVKEAAENDILRECSDFVSAIEHKKDELFFIDKMQSQERHALPSALFVYGRVSANEPRPSYSMMYAGQGAAFDGHWHTSLELVGRTSRIHKKDSNNSGRESLNNGNPSTNPLRNNEPKVMEKMIKDESGGDAKGENHLEAWLCDVKEEAIRRGVNKNVVEKVLAGVTISKEILENDRNQPELKLSAEEYTKRMVCDLRISNGLAAFRENKPLLNEISAKYGVPAPVLVAIWGIESSYGAFTGSWDTIQALVTLAYGSDQPRRASFFREELIHAMMIIEHGHGPQRDRRLKGSWAGAMGQCQFMPSSFQFYAVDHDGDGCKDIWESHADIFASIANYLQAHGWKKGCPVAQKVTVLETLDKSVVGLTVKKTLAEWKSNYEVQLLEGEQYDFQNEIASLVAPDGLKGAVYLVFDNFKTIMRYNTSVLYSISVYELSNIIANKSEPEI